MFSKLNISIIVGAIKLILAVIKHPARDACLYLGERGERMGPLALPVLPAPAFLLLIAQQPLGRFSSNLAHVCVKHKNAFISETMQDTVILTKFFTHRVSADCAGDFSHKLFSCHFWRPS